MTMYDHRGHSIDISLSGYFNEELNFIDAINKLILNDNKRSYRNQFIEEVEKMLHQMQIESRVIEMFHGRPMCQELAKIPS